MIINLCSTIITNIKFQSYPNKMKNSAFIKKYKTVFIIY